MTQDCYTGRAGSNGVGLCRGGTQTCTALPSGSGWGTCTGEVIPGVELCDGGDQDCDGTPNTGCGCTVGAMQSCYSGPMGTDGVGLCHGGNQTCVAMGNTSSWTACGGEVTPGTNTCDGVDRMCNNMPSAGCACSLGSTQACYTGAANTNGVGVCHGGTQNCAVINNLIQWDSTCTNQVTPAAAEVCGNGADDNCDGATDEGCGGAVQCPGDQTVLAGNDLALSATAMGLSGITWTITNGPTGGAGTVVWNPSPPTGPNVSFRAYIVGVYTIQVSGRDANGLDLRNWRIVALSNSGRTREVVELIASLDVDSLPLALLGVSDGFLARTVVNHRVVSDQPEEAVAATISVLGQALTLAHALADHCGRPFPRDLLIAAIGTVLNQPIPNQLLNTFAGIERVLWFGPDDGVAAELALKTVEVCGIAGIRALAGAVTRSVDRLAATLVSASELPLPHPRASA